MGKKKNKTTRWRAPDGVLWEKVVHHAPRQEKPKQEPSSGRATGSGRNSPAGDGAVSGVRGENGAALGQKTGDASSAAKSTPAPKKKPAQTSSQPPPPPPLPEALAVQALDKQLQAVRMLVKMAGGSVDEASKKHLVYQKAAEQSLVDALAKARDAHARVDPASRRAVL